MEYDKLVRDKVIKIIEHDGLMPVFHTASAKEYSKKLLEKLEEEVHEFSENQNKEEMADILEVIDAICKDKRFDPKDIDSIKHDKNLKRGGFNKKIILERTEKNQDG